LSIVASAADRLVGRNGEDLLLRLGVDQLWLSRCRG
jgi:hypothetical protein